MDKIGSIVLQDTDYYSIDFIWETFMIQIGKLWKIIENIPSPPQQVYDFKYLGHFY